VAEPFLSDVIKDGLGMVLPAPTIRQFDVPISIFSVAVITYVTVVVGELVPKYVTLRRTDQVAMLTIRPLRFCVNFLKPLVWLVQRSGSALAGQGSNPDEEAVSRDELLMLVRSGTNAGTFDKGHGEFVTRALRLDNLAARDIMIHRIDIKWLDASLSQRDLLTKLKKLPYNRFPVCRGDIDDLIGVVYIHDILKTLDDPNFDLAKLARPAVAVPENLSLDRLVEMMRENKTQMVIVMDEYGGTSGLITLEDVIEEVFGELEDSLESERPAVKVVGDGRVSAKAEIRFDELVSRLGLDLETSRTETLATMVVEELERVPKTGDVVQTELGTLRVENMARSRITRVSLQLLPEFAAQVAADAS
jgi:CBS domain containing-hemolysin-like protein